MLTASDIKMAEEASLLTISEISAEKETFDYRAFYIEQFNAFCLCAKTWRKVAATAEADGDEYTVMMAIKNTIENESLANQAAFKAKQYP